MWFSKLPQRFWKDETNQRNFLHDLAKKYNLSKPSNWDSITIANIIEQGGSGLLKQHGYSLVKALKKLYPGKPLPLYLTPENDWDSLSKSTGLGKYQLENNRRKLLEKIAKKLGITKPIEWAGVSNKVLFQNGAQALFRRYNYSIYEMLSKNFPGSNLLLLS